MKLKKWNYWISLLAICFLLIQSITGVVSYINSGQEQDRSQMMGQAPTMQMGGNSTSTSEETSDSVDSSSDTTQDQTQAQNGMTPPEMSGDFPQGETSNGILGLIMNLVGLVISGTGLIFTLLLWRKKAPKETVS